MDDAPRLDDAEIGRRLRDLPGWERDGDAIVRTFRTENFPDAIAFVVRLAHAAEKAFHHPELSNVYNRVEVRLTTHDAGGVTTKDLDLAEDVDAAAEGLAH